MKKLIIILVVVGVLAAVVFFSQTRSTEEATEVEVEAVATRSLTAVVEASGQIEPKVSVDISSDVIGRIVDMGVDEGDVVRRGQFLIQIDPTQFQQRAARLEAEVASATTSLQEARANLMIRKSDFDRDRRLFEEKLIPRSQFEASEAAYEVTVAQVASARSRIRQTEASLAEARDNLERCRIVSPMDGVVIRKNAEIGETAISGTLNNAGSLLLTIADLSVMETEVDVDETDVVHVTLGQPVEVELDAFPSRTFRGEVTRIANSAIQNATAPGQRQSVDYKVEVTLLDTDERIRPGLSATARITTDARTDVLAVPIQALVVRETNGEVDEDATASASAAGVALAANRSDAAAGGETDEPGENGDAPAATDADGKETGSEGQKKKEEKEGVFVVRDGKAVFVPLETGIAGEQYFEVVGGALQEGDRVISGNFAALRRLEDGDAVTFDEEDDDKDNEGAGDDGDGEAS